MLRFCRKDFISTEGVQMIMAEDGIGFNQDMWQGARQYFKCGVCDDADVIRLLPVMDEKQEIVCYAYQDDEANRELRMLKELARMKDALQFEDVFPDIHKVIVYGCNELAYYFVKYLENRPIAVSVMGSYWEYMGYTEARNAVQDADTFIVYAEDVFPCAALDQMVIRSASPAFECVDKIYESNVKMGIIRDTEGDFEHLLKELRGKEIIILETSLKAQDTYDLLCGHGIDIGAFVEERKDKAIQNKSRTLLGKKVVSFERALSLWKNAVFIDCCSQKSALGSRHIELLDYYGYERNKQLFLINDYIDVPFSNLVHVMYGKKVLLTGDECLCKILSEYLYQIEKDNVEVEYICLGQKVTEGEDYIRCLVVPNLKNQRKGVDAENVSRRNKLMADMGFDNYTEYFMRHRAFALIDRYLNSGNEKYTVPKLTPRGICLGRIPPYSGNFFFRGIMDGHPEILMIPYSDLNTNLFYYCIRLAGCDSDEILPKFWKMYDVETASKENYFTDVEKFEESFKRMASLKKVFTSQELFIMFHIAYEEMLSGKQFCDVSDLIVYWEPHYIARDEFPFFALWLEDKKINGQTVRLRRNNMMRTGSACERAASGYSYRQTVMYGVMFLEEVDSDTVGERCPCQYWAEHKLRFEDIKVYSKDTLMKVCEWLGISWSDSMMKTTELGEACSYRGSLDFDLQPVFKKSEDFLSEFDRLRISIACSPYQKKYGYTYENCMKFSRKELQEMFLKSFFFEEREFFDIGIRDYMELYEQMKWNLWNVRKHMVLDDISPEFERFELKQTGKK